MNHPGQERAMNTGAIRDMVREICNWDWFTVDDDGLSIKVTFEDRYGKPIGRTAGDRDWDEATWRRHLHMGMP
jgi:hypothetical protein